MIKEKLITILIAILLALGGWNLKETYSISKDMVLIKEKVATIQNEVSNSKNFKKKKKRKKKNENNYCVGSIYNDIPFQYFISFNIRV